MIIIIIIVSFITVYACVFLYVSRAQTMHLEHQLRKSIILFIN